MSKYFVNKLNVDVRDDENDIEDLEEIIECGLFDLDTDEDEKQIYSSFESDFHYEVVDIENKDTSTIRGTFYDYSMTDYDVDNIMEIMDSISGHELMVASLLYQALDDDLDFTSKRVISLYNLKIHNDDKKLFKTIMNNMIGLVWQKERFIGNCVTIMDDILTDWQKEILEELGFEHYYSKSEEVGIYYYNNDSFMDEVNWM